MRAYQIKDSFGIDHLALVNLADPKPRANEVLIRIHAASLNFRDYLMVEGKYNPKLQMPMIPLSDGCGQIVEVGSAVSEYQVGDWVMPIFAQKWFYGQPNRAIFKQTLGGPLHGTLCELMAVPEYALVKKPDYLTPQEAATLPCAGLTAWSALVTHGKIKPADTILVLGTGGVSIFALQIAKHFGARVMVTSSSDEKLARAKNLGADELINYREHKNWERQVLKLTDMNGVDNVIEVGGAGTLEKSIASVKLGGQISLIGILAGSSESLNLLPILMRDVRLQGVLVGHKQGFEAMLAAFSRWQLKPVIDKEFSFAEVKSALSEMAAARHFGKIVINMV